jgi:hypothetical protein
VARVARQHEGAEAEEGGMSDMAVKMVIDYLREISWDRVALFLLLLLLCCVCLSGFYRGKR